MAAQTPLVALVNHNPALLRLLQEVLSEKGLRTVFMPQGATAFASIKQQKPDLVMLDTWLEDREVGWQLIDTLRLDKATRDIRILICSSDLIEFEKRMADLEKQSGIEVLNKPYDIDMLADKIGLMLSPAQDRNGHPQLRL